jgi:hypothetical protein
MIRLQQSAETEISLFGTVRGSRGQEIGTVTLSKETTTYFMTEKQGKYLGLGDSTLIAYTSGELDGSKVVFAEWMFGEYGNKDGAPCSFDPLTKSVIKAKSYQPCERKVEDKICMVLPQCISDLNTNTNSDGWTEDQVQAIALYSQNRGYAWQRSIWHDINFLGHPMIKSLNPALLSEDGLAAYNQLSSNQTCYGHLTQIDAYASLNPGCPIACTMPDSDIDEKTGKYQGGAIKLFDKLVSEANELGTDDSNLVIMITSSIHKKYIQELKVVNGGSPNAVSGIITGIEANFYNGIPIIVNDSWSKVPRDLGFTAHRAMCLPLGSLGIFLQSGSLLGENIESNMRLYWNNENPEQRNHLFMSANWLQLSPVLNIDKIVQCVSKWIPFESTNCSPQKLA